MVIYLCFRPAQTLRKTVSRGGLNEAANTAKSCTSTLHSARLTSHASQYTPADAEFQSP